MVSATYWDYIRVEELTDLQAGLAQQDRELTNDEHLFIVAHQVHELWFKLVIRELESACELFNRDPVPETSLAAAARGLRRVCRIFRLATEHFSLLETMTTRDYLDFRDKLTPASGFQSAQFREIEILLGLENSQRIPLNEKVGTLDVLKTADGQTTPAWERVNERISAGISLRVALEQWLARTPIDGSRPSQGNDQERVDGFLTRFLRQHEHAIQAALGERSQSDSDRNAVQAKFQVELEQARDYLMDQNPRTRRIRAAILFIECYRELPLLAWPREILDHTLEVEQTYLIFRQRHARMVERMIGRRVGTGGSDGVDYLDRTALAYRVFPDLWKARTFLLRRDHLPSLDHGESYQFKADQG